MSSKRAPYYDPIASFRPKYSESAWGKPTRAWIKSRKRKASLMHKRGKGPVKPRKYQAPVFCGPNDSRIIPAAVLRRYRGECHVEGWGQGPTFVVVKSDGVHHHLRTRSSGKHYHITHRLLFTVKERRRYFRKVIASQEALSPYTHAACVPAVEEPQRHESSTVPDTGSHRDEPRERIAACAVKGMRNFDLREVA